MKIETDRLVITEFTLDMAKVVSGVGVYQGKDREIVKSVWRC